MDKRITHGTVGSTQLGNGEWLRENLREFIPQS